MGTSIYWEKLIVFSIFTFLLIHFNQDGQ